uniref:Fatty acyl-CoA reductase n=1 Tax=Lutzomyia longipalpis TaxID=7200 RepID=A0A1B0C9F8_LUTLO
MKGVTANSGSPENLLVASAAKLDLKLKGHFIRQIMDLANECNDYVSVPEFYTGRSVFITGGTGFLGKVLIEKLLRLCPGIRNIYLLIRPKRGQKAKDRFSDLLGAPIFDKLRREHPNSLNKLIPIYGDISLEMLGLSKDDQALLCRYVSVVFHLAATVKFDEKLKLSVTINTLGTKRLIELCHKMIFLKALVHVSTAFCNSDRSEVSEVIYPPPYDANDIISLVKWLPEDLLDNLTPSLIGKRPNTYTFTKALAEHVLSNEANNLPITIVRPSVGWLDNYYGPTLSIILQDLKLKGHFIRQAMDLANECNDYVSVPEFYTSRSVFITGGTGFLGKVLIEKLLGSCPGIRNIYLLIRPKRGQKAKDRFSDLLEAPALLCRNVSVVFHLAATVKFDEKLKLSVTINTLGTKRIVELCHKMIFLKALVHVSTAFCNSDRSEVSEVIYPPHYDSNDIISLVKWLPEDLLDDLTPSLIGKRPNTYTFTKALAEHVLSNEANNLPITIVRPSVVLSSLNEPVPGWLDNYYGPTLSIILQGMGLVRVMLIDKSIRSDFIPVDIVANLMIVSAWRQATTTNKNVIVYNCISGKDNPLDLGRFIQLCTSNLRKYPLENSFYYPYGLAIYKQPLYSISTYLLQTIPTGIVDVICLLTKGKRKYGKILKKYHIGVEKLRFFSTRQLEFQNENVRELRDVLSTTDQKLFNIDVSQMSWEDYLENYVLGFRTYLLKQSTDSLPKSRQRLQRYLFHFFVHEPLFYEANFVLIEKLLRSCPGIGNIYLLIRPKRGQEVKDRFSDLLGAPIFDKRRQEHPNSLNKLIPIYGDISLEVLGLSKDDQALLCRNVSVVFHLAATVKFDEKLKLSVTINTLGTKRLIELCHKMIFLKALVHVSTAFCNSDRSEVSEVIYPPPYDANDIISLVKWLPEDLLDNLTPSLIGKRPNTYTFTKALAEHVLSNEATDLPVAIVRPSITLSSLNEPVPGWLDNYYGPTGTTVLQGMGLVRVILIDKSKRVDFIPVDIVANLMIVSAWRQATMADKSLVVYNCVSRENPLDWGRFVSLSTKYLRKYPLDQKLFNIDVSRMSWEDYLENYVLGFRTYLLKQSTDSLPKSRQRLQMYASLFFH